MNRYRPSAQFHRADVVYVVFRTLSLIAAETAPNLSAKVALPVSCRAGEDNRLRPVRPRAKQGEYLGLNGMGERERPDADPTGRFPDVLVVHVVVPQDRSILSQKAD